MKDDITISRKLACDLLEQLRDSFIGNFDKRMIHDLSEQLASAMMVSDWKNQKKHQNI